MRRSQAAATTCDKFNGSTPPAIPSDDPVSQNLPFGKPLPGKPGFATSPYTPESGYVDVRGLKTGSEVKCPYTGKMFLVP